MEKWGGNQVINSHVGLICKGRLVPGDRRRPRRARRTTTMKMMTDIVLGGQRR